jgi:hypothetical protein
MHPAARSTAARKTVVRMKYLFHGDDDIRKILFQGNK